MTRRARALSSLLALAVAACELPAVHGRVLDRESGAPIAGAVVVELWRDAGWIGEPARARHARFATSDADGRFALESARVSGRGDHPPVYVFAHPEYGLVHAGELAPIGGTIELRGARGEVTPSQSLRSLCESPPREDWERELAGRLCARR